MGDDDRVVLRTGIAVPAVAIGVSLLVIGVPSWAFGGSFMVWGAAIGVVIGTVLSYGHRKVVLTSRGLEIWSFGYTFVPWSQVSDVSVGGSRWTERYVTVLVMPYAPPTKLAAPRATLGLGESDVERARELVEQWWLRHKGDAVGTAAPAPVPWTDHVPPRDDLWAPPPS